MRYQRSLDIEQRLDTVLALIREGQYSTPALATRLHVSVPTVSRDVAALRQRGYDIVAARGSGGWSYRLNNATRRTSPPSPRHVRGPRGWVR